MASRPPLIPSLIADWLPMVRAFGILATTNCAYYLTFTYIVERRKNLPGGGAAFLLANTLSLFAVLIAKPFGGWFGSCRAAEADADPEHRHCDAHLPGISVDAIWDTAAIRT